VIACGALAMWLPVNADFIRIDWSVRSQIPFTLWVTATSTADQICNLT